MVVLTDGHSQDSVVAASQALAADGVTVFAIGVGNYDRSELLQIANNKPDHVFELTDFIGLAQNIHLIFGTVCNDGTTTATQATVAVCPVAGYVSYNGVCYKDFAELKTYDEARQTCAADGGLLAMPKDDATNTFIHNLGGGAAIRWIGLTDLGNEGQFVYEDGQSLASSGYSNWHPGEPNDAHQGEHCVMMFDTTHGWNDATCSLARGFICQLG
ncbi:C-type lectin-like [Branchiostoma floridae x Branchiostoma belcheri]